MNDRQDTLLKELAQKLMRDVYAAFSACIWLDGAGRILELYQFDTQYCRPRWTAPAGAQVCALISNHPDGNMSPFDQDMKNWKRLKDEYPSLLCRLMIHAEDEGVCEIEEA